MRCLSPNSGCRGHFQSKQNLIDLSHTASTWKKNRYEPCDIYGISHIPRASQVNKIHHLGQTNWCLPSLRAVNVKRLPRTDKWSGWDKCHNDCLKEKWQTQKKTSHSTTTFRGHRTALITHVTINDSFTHVSSQSVLLLDCNTVYKTWPWSYAEPKELKDIQC